MEIDLTEIGMFEGQQYEAIITTLDKDGNSNAAPFGVRVLENNTIFLRIFEGGNTIKNIKERKEFIVNITTSPLMFTFATTNTIPDEHLSRISKDNDEMVYLTDADAYLVCKATSIKESYRENDPIKDTGINFIKAEIAELKINNKCVKPINRGIHALIESLVNYSRINIVNEEKQKYFIERFLESERLIKRVGNKEEKESIKILREYLENQGYEILKSDD